MSLMGIIGSVRHVDITSEGGRTSSRKRVWMRHQSTAIRTAARSHFFSLPNLKEK
jgi:hypothetical protein